MPASEIHFRKIEIKELPPEAPGPRAGAILKGGYVAPDLRHAKPLFEDRFQSPAIGWSIGKSGDRESSGYEGGRYFIAVVPPAGSLRFV